MAWIRQLPRNQDGVALWAGTVYLPSGDRVTETRELKGQIEKWARDLEASFDKGQWIDPRGAKVKIGEIWDRWTSKRSQAKNSRQRDHSHYRVYVEPRWGAWPCGSVLKPDIDVWVGEMQERKPEPVGAASIQAAVGVLRAILDNAVDAKLIAYNVAKQVKCPDRDAHLDRVLDDDEAHLLLDNAEARFPGRPDAHLLLDLMLNCGLRYEEACALDREHVDMRARLVHIGPVIEKDGTIKPFPKSKAAIRPVPVDDELWPRVRARAMATAPGQPLIVMPRGGNMLYDSWRDRVYLKCLTAEAEMAAEEVAAWRAAEKRAGRRGWRPRYVREVPLLADPQPTPHDLRHTYGTRLGEAGVPPHEIMALMGHETLESVQRYLHARDGRFEKARQMTMNLRQRSSTLH
jgi:integrase